MRVGRLLPSLLSIILLCASVILVSQQQAQKITRADRATYDESLPQGEMRGLWVSYMELDVQGEKDKKAVFEKKIDRIVSEMKHAGFNTMIVQVRPFSDALYRSTYYPWSHILTGTQGVDPGFDPLEIVIDKAHQNRIAVHAWINPYRIATAQTPNQFSQDNPYVKDPTLGVEINKNLYMNPSSKKAMQLITDGVGEIVENYDVDGIQFDDYFYPEDCGDFDKKTYEAYQKNASSPLSLSEYRKENVNTLIRMVYLRVHKQGDNIVFGISPQGNLKNNESLCADVEKWCVEDGYIDYICPQIYFSLDNPALGFEDALSDWLKLKRHSDLKLYIGLAGYKAGTDADDGTWLDNSDILSTEISIIRDEDLDGFMLFSSDSLHSENGEQEIENVIRYLTTPTQQPPATSVINTS